ncbi:hypothetical protein RN001_007820 [Aquatica leii]|uniref:Uncharacterized protein n=1 Tax=Aquatica leii TaxID=1421715 RepID=A0AAN7SH00_9COLE|nr:hypothetical protein RN001_007820 [Aquatica leii]
MVVSNKSAFQLKLKYFEDISHENYKYNSANSSRRNTIELETSAFEDTKYEHVEKNNVTCNPGSEYNNSVKSLEGSKIVEPEISLSLRKTINDVRKQFLQFSSTDIDSSAEQRINTHNKKEKLNKGNRNSASLVESAQDNNVDTEEIFDDEEGEDDVLDHKVLDTDSEAKTSEYYRNLS